MAPGKKRKLVSVSRAEAKRRRGPLATIQMVCGDCIFSLMCFLNFTELFALMRVCKAWLPLATRAQNRQHVELCHGPRGLSLHYSYLINYKPEDSSRYLYYPPLLGNIPHARLACFQDLKFFGFGLLPVLPSLRKLHVFDFTTLATLNAPNIQELSMSLNYLKFMADIVEVLGHFPNLKRVVFHHYTRKTALFNDLFIFLTTNRELVVESRLYQT
jgi:hypothetical protein